MINNSKVKWGKKDFFKAITAFLLNTLLIIAFMAVVLFIKCGNFAQLVAFFKQNLRLFFSAKSMFMLAQTS